MTARLDNSSAVLPGASAPSSPAIAAGSANPGPAVLAGVGTILGALGTPSPATLDTWLGEFPPTIEVVAWLDRQGLAPLAFHHLATHGLLDRLDPAVAGELRHLAQIAAAIESVRAPELGRVMRALHGAGIESVLLKGSVLAFTVYPDSSCRDRCDIDVWIDPAEHERAARALAGLGYRFAEKQDRPHPLALALGGEMQMVNDRLGCELLELQWPAFRGEWCRLATKIDQADAWSRRIPCPRALPQWPAHPSAPPIPPRSARRNPQLCTPPKRQLRPLRPNLPAARPRLRPAS